MKKTQVFLFPFAGGNSYSFSKITEQLPVGIEPITLDYPGHGMRAKERFLLTFEDLIVDVAEQINAQIAFDTNIVFFGYSLGSLLAFECMARNLISEKVSCAILCAQEAPMFSSFSERSLEWTDDNVIDYTIKLGGIDSRLKDNPRFLKALLLPTKYDYIVRESYQYTGGVVNCPMHIAYSEQDTPFSTVDMWRECCNNQITLQSYKGNHFFINNNIAPIVELLINTINKITYK